jgi:hypothetical protein
MSGLMFKGRVLQMRDLLLEKRSVKDLSALCTDRL